MAIIKYQVKENKTLGTHSFYAQAVSFSTLNFQDLAEEVVEGLGISPELVNTILERYMRVAKRNVLRGHRVRFGDLLTIYPQLSCSVKDELNQDGTVKTPVTLEMFNLSSAKSSIGATIAQSVQQSFSSSVSWKRVSEKEEEEESNDNVNGNDNGNENINDDSSDSSDSSDGGTTPGGNNEEG